MSLVSVISLHSPFHHLIKSSSIATDHRLLVTDKSSSHANRRSSIHTNHRSSNHADQIIKSSNEGLSDHQTKPIKSSMDFGLGGWWFGLIGFQVGRVMNGFGIEWIWDWLGLELSGLVFLDDASWVVMMVVGCGGIVSSDGSVRERGGEGENNKKL